MNFNFETIIFYILLLDSLFANIVAWFGPIKIRDVKIFSRYFPLTKGWTSYYLILVIFIGWILYKYGVLI